MITFGSTKGFQERIKAIKASIDEIPREIDKTVFEIFNRRKQELKITDPIKLFLNKKFALKTDQEIINDRKFVHVSLVKSENGYSFVYESPIDKIALRVIDVGSGSNKINPTNWLTSFETEANITLKNKFKKTSILKI